MRIRPPDFVALIVGAIVLLLPIGVAVAGMFAALSSDAVRPPDSGGRTLATFLLEAGTLTVLASPLVVLAGLRARVHAARYVAQQGRGWQGVAEAAAVGFCAAILPLTRGILTRPGDAPPYVLFYCGAGLLIGLLYGVVLRTIAVAVLGVIGRRGAP
jgi:hypothetical protein